MCTAISVTAGDMYFGRNLDYEHGFGEKIVITPRAMPLMFRGGACMAQHYAVIGMALPYAGYPLYFDACNEKGLSMAGLNFPGYAHYEARKAGKDNVASFEMILWVLGQCASVTAAERLLARCNITAEAFCADLPPSPLHWMIADKTRAVAAEQTREGLRVTENPSGVLTNSPPLEWQLFRLNDYRAVSASETVNTFAPNLELKSYSNGLGGLGLPGDFSSMSRFVRAAFVRANAVFEGGETEKVSQFFHVLQSVAQTEGCVRTEHGPERTEYSVCCNASRGVYYYTTYHNSRIHGVALQRENVQSREMIVYDLVREEKIPIQNGG